MEQLNNFLGGVSSNISSDEDEPRVTENSSPPPSPNLSKKQQQQQHKVMKSTKCMAELCEEIQSLGQYARFNPNFPHCSISSISIWWQSWYIIETRSASLLWQGTTFGHMSVSHTHMRTLNAQPLSFAALYGIPYQ